MHTWPTQETATIKGNGYILGKVSSVDGKQILITPKTASLPNEWVTQPSAKPVRADDLVCCLEGASKLMIVRPCKDYFSFILILAAHLDNMTTEFEAAGQPEQSFLHDFLLTWTWESSQMTPGERDGYK